MDTPDKKQKPSLEEEDMSSITRLPDPILQHILSFLPTKRAVGTSILSSRWTHLWTSIPNLEFHLHHYPPTTQFDKTNFKKFVDRVLLLHDAPTIHKFHLLLTYLHVSDSTRIQSCVDSWISTVVNCKIEEIELKIFAGCQRFVLPHCLLTCESLKVLKINSVCDIKLPNSIHLPKLEFLHLSEVEFVGECFVQRVGYSFPSLEEFCLVYCDWQNFKTVELFVPKLKRFTVFDSSHDSGYEIKVYAETLVSLVFDYRLPWKYSIHNSFSLVDASIVVYVDHERGRWVSQFLGGISCVKDLALSDDIVEAVFKAGEVSDLLVFPNLTTLRVISRKALTCEALMNLLHKSPNLESLVIDDKAGTFTYKEEDWALTIMPQCFLSHLKYIELTNFNGEEDKLSVVEFFLQNTRILERMTIVFSPALFKDLMKHIEVSKQLLVLPRGSRCCTIDFA